VHALLALLWLQSSRLDARIDGDGSLLPLSEQDRSRWDQARIDRGLDHLTRAGQGERLTERHLLAGIAACHAVAKGDADTDWPRILGYYDMLLEIRDTPLIRLNRAVALGRVEGPAAALRALATVGEDPRFADYHLLLAARADAHERMGDRPRSREELDRAAELAPSRAERAFLHRRRRELA
jgi:RNA polymerase sigma-70 factor (ECF subfamily)